MKNLGAEAFQERIDQAQNSFFFELEILEQNYDMKDPESKTAFHKEIAKKLCGFEEDVERENYIQSVAEKYHIGFDNLRKLVNGYAARTGLAQPVTRPKAAVTRKDTPEENAKKSQRLLLTWLVEEPEVYEKIKPYIKADDFTDELYRNVADRLFQDLEQGKFNPAAIISTFEEEEEQRAVAEIFNTKLAELTTKQEREKAFHDIIYAVKKNSFEYYSARMGSDMNALNQVISGKKALEVLGKTHISL
jgi:DNA primase